MQPPKKNREAHSLPKGKWREKYACRPNKGDHVFVLVKPPFLDSYADIKKLSVLGYYKREEERREKEEKEYRKNGIENRGIYRLFGITKWYRCKHCGKIELESSGRINKRIRIRELP